MVVAQLILQEISFLPPLKALSVFTFNNDLPQRENLSKILENLLQITFFSLSFSFHFQIFHDFLYNFILIIISIIVKIFRLVDTQKHEKKSE